MTGVADLRRSATYRGVSLKRSDLAIFDSGSGVLARVPAQIRLVEAPGGSRLVWRAQPDRDSRSVEGLIWRFVRLADARDEEIVDFARKWGVLGICDHDRPGTHDGCHPRSTGTLEKGECWEPVEVWRRIAGQMQATLTLAGQLYEPDLAWHREWTATQTKALGDSLATAAEAQQAAVLTQGLTLAMHDAAIYPMAVWDPELRACRVELRRAGSMAPPSSSLSFSYSWPANALYSVLVTQMVVACSAPLYRCEDCQLPFEADRRPRFDRARRCEACRPLAKTRRGTAWAKERRAKQRAKRAASEPPV